ADTIEEIVEETGVSGFNLAAVSQPETLRGCGSPASSGSGGSGRAVSSRPVCVESAYRLREFRAVSIRIGRLDRGPASAGDGCGTRRTPAGQLAVIGTAYERRSLAPARRHPLPAAVPGA